MSRTLALGASLAVVLSVGGVGSILEIDPSNGERLELVSVTSE